MIVAMNQNCSNIAKRIISKINSLGNIQTSMHLKNIALLLCLLLWIPIRVFAGESNSIAVVLKNIARNLKQETGVYILERGEQALMGRAWLADHAEKTIDVQYFIWSDDNIGRLAAEALVRAADRGVKVRVIVDDLLVDADTDTLLAIASHPNIDIRIYNPQQSVGVSSWKKMTNVLTGFRQVNQRMHDKTALFDGVVGITGGRNMADEYYDFDQTYNFRDRDILVVGAVVADMNTSFERFWQSKLSRPLERLLKKEFKQLETQQIELHIAALHRYAQDPSNYEPEIKKALIDLPQYFPTLLNDLVWTEARFISDMPGKNTNKFMLSGSGQTTEALIDVLSAAKKTITIQSPYLIMPDGGLEFFREKVQQGVVVKIITNSLASTDNLLAYSGYHKIRSDLLRAGIELYEFNPQPQIQEELVEHYKKFGKKPPIFALHAKTLVVDSETLYIGTFNFDPRSANLNTEVGVLVSNHQLAQQVEQAIQRDMEPQNSWKISSKASPDREVGFIKRLKLFGLKLLPIDSLL